MTKIELKIRRSVMHFTRHYPKKTRSSRPVTRHKGTCLWSTLTQHSAHLFKSSVHEEIQRTKTKPSIRSMYSQSNEIARKLNIDSLTLYYPLTNISIFSICGVSLISVRVINLSYSDNVKWRLFQIIFYVSKKSGHEPSTLRDIMGPIHTYPDISEKRYIFLSF